MPVIAPILSVAVAGWSTSVAIAGGANKPPKLKPLDLE